MILMLFFQSCSARHFWYAIALLVFVSGCVTAPTITEKGLLMKMDANPKEVFSDGIATISVDLENQDVKTLSNVSTDIFETGSLDFTDASKCTKDFGSLEPKDFKTFACNLKAKGVTMDNIIWARAKYNSTLSAVQTFDIISQTELEIRKKTEKPDSQKSFSFRDNSLELAMELSNAPIVYKTGKEYVSFKIKNIGSGFIEKLGAADIQIAGKNVELQCPSSDIFIINKEFPRISCAINAGGSVTSFITAEISIKINYGYEIRDSVNVRIIK